MPMSDEPRVVGPGFHAKAFAVVRRVPPGRVGQTMTAEQHARDRQLSLRFRRAAVRERWVNAVGLVAQVVGRTLTVRCRGGRRGTADYHGGSMRRLRAIGMGMVLVAACETPQALAPRSETAPDADPRSPSSSERRAPPEMDAPAPPKTPREAYEQQLNRSGLAATPAGREWFERGAALLEAPAEVDLPLLEDVAFGPQGSRGRAFAFELREGHRLSASADGSDASSAALLDLFFVDDEGQRLIELGSRRSSLSMVAPVDGRYIVRVQPALEDHATRRLEVRASPSLRFPVEGRGRKSVQSFFGASREGGKRSHHGIDIFAPRGTPVLASAGGRVVRVGQTPRGGNVVWLRDDANALAIYYAHLERATVELGDHVEVGDPVGEVGNSGNARYGKPHLHFGIYRRGPTDPLPFVHVRPRPERPPTTSLALGQQHRVRRGTLRLRTAPLRGDVVATLQRDAPVVPLAARGSSVLVRTADGARGWAPSRWLEPDPEAVDAKRFDGDRVR